MSGPRSVDRRVPCRCELSMVSTHGGWRVPALKRNAPSQWLARSGPCATKSTSFHHAGSNTRQASHCGRMPEERDSLREDRLDGTPTSSRPTGIRHAVESCVDMATVEAGSGVLGAGSATSGRHSRTSALWREKHTNWSVCERDRVFPWVRRTQRFNEPGVTVLAPAAELYVRLE